MATTSYSRDPNAQGYQGYQAQTPTAQSAAASTASATANVSKPAGQQYKNQVGQNWSGYQTQLNDWYQQYLGRTPGQEDYAAHAGSPNYSTLLSTIQNSPEAQAYGKKQAAQAQGATYASATATPVQGDGTVPPATPMAQSGGSGMAQGEMLTTAQNVSQRKPGQGLPNYDYLSKLYEQLIEHPAFSPEVVTQMKERAKEQGTSLLQQQQQGIGQQFASMGRYGSGAQMAGQAQAQQAANENILGAFRGIDIDTAGRNAAQQLQAGQGYANLGLGQVGAQDSAINNILNWARFFDSGALARTGLGLNAAQLQGTLQNQLLSMILGYGGGG